MIETSARVVSSVKGTILIQPTTQSGCGGCHSRSVCGVSGLGKYFSGNRQPIAVKCDSNVQSGDELQLILNEADLLKAGLLAYLLPCITTLIGAGLASGWGNVAAVAGAVTGFGVGFGLARVSGWAPQMEARKVRASIE